MVDRLEHAIEEPEREAPDHVATGLADEHTGKARFGHVLHEMFHLSIPIVKTGEREPEGLLDLLRIEIEVSVLPNVKRVRRYDQMGLATPIPRKLVHVAQILGAFEGDSDLLEGLPGRSRTHGIVMLFHPTPRKRHVAGPGIVGMEGSFDQQDFRRARAFAQDDRDGGSMDPFEIHGLRRVRGELPAYVIDVHAPTVAPPEGAVRAEARPAC